jgi:hypothetical protein
VGFTLYNKFFNGLLADIARFDPFLEDLGPFLRSDLRGNLGDGYQLQAYINQGLLEPWKRFKEFLCCLIVKVNPFLCREAIEECTFAGHSWELRSSDLGAVSFDGFLRSGIT